MNSVLAQRIIIGDTATIIIEGPLKYNNIGEMVSTIMNLFIFPLSGVIMLFMFLWAGYDLMMAGQDPKRLDTARNRLKYSLIGFFIIIAAFLIVSLIKFLLGIREEGVFF